MMTFYKNKAKEVNYQGLILNLSNDFNIYESNKKQIKTIYASNNIVYKSMGVTAQLSPSSFHQVNDEVALKLYESVLSHIKGNLILNCYIVQQ